MSWATLILLGWKSCFLGGHPHRPLILALHTHAVVCYTHAAEAVLLLITNLSEGPAVPHGVTSQHERRPCILSLAPWASTHHGGEVERRKEKHETLQLKRRLFITAELCLPTPAAIASPAAGSPRVFI